MEPAHQHNEDTQANRLIKFGMRLGVSAALHPFEYAKVLIQVMIKSKLDIGLSVCGLDRRKIVCFTVPDWV